MHDDHAKLLPPALALVIIPINQAMLKGRLHYLLACQIAIGVP